MATVFGPVGYLGASIPPADLSVALPGPETSTTCPFCGAVVNQHWIAWDRLQTHGPRGGELKPRKQLPFVVEMYADRHECSAVADDPHLSLRREISAMEMACSHSFSSENEHLEALIDQRRTLLHERDGR